MAARRSGIEVSGIDLFFFGGVMKMNRDTDTPGKEFFVAVAGPLVTLALVVVGSAVGLALAGTDDFLDAARLDGAAPTDVALLLVSFLVTMNAVLLVFNLVPAFPLDGGRIARAAIWKVTGDRAKATRVAAYIGQGFAVLLMAYGIFQALDGDAGNGIWLAVLGYLLFSSARAAVVQSAVTSRLEGVTVADIMDAEPVTIPAQTPRRAGLRRVLPALPGLAVVRRGRGGRPLRGPRVPRGGRGRRRTAGPRCHRSASWPPPPARSATTRRWRPCSPPSRCAASAR